MRIDADFYLILTDETAPRDPLGYRPNLCFNHAVKAVLAWHKVTAGVSEERLWGCEECANEADAEEDLA